MRNVSSQASYWKKVDARNLVNALQDIRAEVDRTRERWGFLCIGSDQSTGDALGPLVGSALREAGYREVFGTLQSPLDASNIEHTLHQLRTDTTYIAIDAALGLASSVGWFQVSNQPLVPGKSLGKKLPPLGDFSIAAIVNESGSKQLQRLQSTSLYRVMTMSQHIVSAVQAVFPKGNQL